MIKPEYLQSIITPTTHVFTTVTGVTPKVERVQVVTSLPVAHSLCVGINFEGQGFGGVYLIVEKAVGQAIAAKMNGKKVEELDFQEVLAALFELMNMAAGNAVGLLIRNGLHVSIEPPQLHDMPPDPPFGAGCAVVNFSSELGNFRLGVMLGTDG